MTTIDMTNKETASKVVMLTLISGLALEIRCPGLKVTRGPSTISVAKRLGFTGRTRKKALEWAVEQMTIADPDYQPGWTTVAALQA